MFFYMDPISSSKAVILPGLNDAYPLQLVLIYGIIQNH